MKQAYKVIDAELHLMEPYDLWERRLAEPYRSRTRIAQPPPGHLDLSRLVQLGDDGVAAPSWASTASDPTGTLLDRHARRVYTAAPEMERAAQHCSPALYLDGLDAAGIDVAILSPTLTMALVRYDGLDPQHALAMCRVYNDWAYEFTQANPARFKFWGFIPPHDAHLAAEEARRCIQDLGAVGVATNLGAIDGHLWSDEFFDPLWEELDRLAAPLGLHLSFAGCVRDELRDRYAGHRRADVTAATVGSRSFLAHTAVAELTVGGVLERYPRLRPVIMESCVSWLPWLLWRLDEKWATFGPDADYALSLQPSAYFKRQCYAVVECEEDVAKYVIDYMGDDNLLLSTDYPHHDSPFPHGIQTFLGLPGIGTASKRKILWDNGAKLFGLGVPEPAPAGGPR